MKAYLGKKKKKLKERKGKAPDKRTPYFLLHVSTGRCFLMKMSSEKIPNPLVMSPHSLPQIMSGFWSWDGKGSEK